MEILILLTGYHIFLLALVWRIWWYINTISANKLMIILKLANSLIVSVKLTHIFSIFIRAKNRA